MSTNNIDGQSNIQIKNLVSIQNENALHYEDPMDYLQSFVNSTVRYEAPNSNFYSFSGEIQNINGSCNLGQNNIILRGSILENTEMVYAVVIYVGSHCKIMKARKEVQTVKKSDLLRKFESLIFSIFVLQILFCAFASVYHIIYLLVNRQILVLYMQVDSLLLLQLFGVNLINWFLMIGTFLPISLNFTIQIVQFFQGMRLPFYSNMQTKVKDKEGNILIDS